MQQPRSFSIKESKALEKLFDEHGERNPVCKNVKQFMYATELANFQKRKNADSHLVKNQRLHFKKLLEEGKFTDFDKQVFHHTLEELYNLQGKCEHIKNTPFSRQFAYFSTLFTWLFLLLLLFGLFNVFETELTEAKQVGSSWPIILMIFFLVLISWIFKPMEKVGSNSEDPFEERINNVPMTALCWTIETRAC